MPELDCVSLLDVCGMLPVYHILIESSCKYEDCRQANLLNISIDFVLGFKNQTSLRYPVSILTLIDEHVELPI